MRPTKHSFSNGQPKGAYIYSIKKDGSRYAKPTWIGFVGNEKTAEDIVARLEKNNTGKKYEIA